ncbi:Transposase [Theobroma cacao]|nr:Transposase [Theobroma cacao]
MERQGGGGGVLANLTGDEEAFLGFKCGEVGTKHESSVEDVPPKNIASEEMIVEGVDCQEGDEGGENYPKYHALGMSKVELEMGMVFSSLVQFRLALKNWAVDGGYDYKFQHNDSIRVSVICNTDPKTCPFKVHSSVVGGEKAFQIKALKPQHTCARTSTMTQGDAKFFDSKILRNI